MASSSHSLGLSRTKQTGCESGQTAHSPHVPVIPYVTFSLAGMKEEKIYSHGTIPPLEYGLTAGKMRRCGRKKPLSSEHAVGKWNMQHGVLILEEPGQPELVLGRWQWQIQLQSKGHRLNSAAFPQPVWDPNPSYRGVAGQFILPALSKMRLGLGGGVSTQSAAAAPSLVRSGCRVSSGEVTLHSRTAVLQASSWTILMEATWPFQTEAC